MQRIASSISALAGAFLVAACGGGDAPKRAASRQAAHGITVTLPAGWRRAPSSLTPHLTDPHEVVAVGTYDLRYRRTDCAQIPGSALEDLGATDAFVTVQERGRGSSSIGFAARPKHFGPRLGGPAEVSPTRTPAQTGRPRPRTLQLDQRFSMELRVTILAARSRFSS